MGSYPGDIIMHPAQPSEAKLGWGAFNFFPHSDSFQVTTG